jgi:hypothetical protein
VALGNCSNRPISNDVWHSTQSTATVILTSTLHDFLGHLMSTSTHTTEIGCEIASLAYSFASESSFPWVSEFGLIGSDLDCAENSCTREL